MTDLPVSTAQLPLCNKRIVITAPRPYAARLSTAMIQQGGLPILMPTIETCALTASPALDTALLNLHSFHWVAFTSRTGIQAVVQRLQQLAIPLSVLNQCHICAIGQDAEYLRELGISVDLIPTEPSPAEYSVGVGPDSQGRSAANFSAFTGFVAAIAQFFCRSAAEIPRQDPVILP